MAADVNADLALLSSPRSVSRAFVATSNVRAPRRPLPPDRIGKGALGRHPQRGAHLLPCLLDFFNNKFPLKVAKHRQLSQSDESNIM